MSVLLLDDPGKMSHSLSNWLQAIKTDDMEAGLAADFDGSLSGLGVELGSSTYNMSEALLALPVFKQESLETGFQYILGAATSPATKMNEETLTYLNQGQSYEVKLKKFGDLSELRGRKLRSVIRVLFHDRRLQFMEREQLDTWRLTRPGERIVDLDVPLSYSVTDIKVESTKLNCFEFKWDPSKDTGVYIKVHCISTEFTANRHGGEKGVPFRIQVETYLDDESNRLLHCGSCQVKVFKPKGADRKHKQDRQKMEKRTEAEKEKYQPSYECTVLTEIPIDQVQNYLQQQQAQELQEKHEQGQRSNSLGSLSNSPPHRVVSDEATPAPAPRQASPPKSVTVTSSSPSPHTTNNQPLRNFQNLAEAYNSSNSTESLPVDSKGFEFQDEMGMVNGVEGLFEIQRDHARQVASIGLKFLCREFVYNSMRIEASRKSLESEPRPLAPNATAAEVTEWLKANRFSQYVKVFQHFSGADLLRLTRDDLIQICSLADGIRLNNALQSRSVRPRLTIYVCQDSSSTTSPDGTPISTTPMSPSSLSVIAPPPPPPLSAAPALSSPHQARFSSSSTSSITLNTSSASSAHNSDASSTSVVTVTPSCLTTAAPRHSSPYVSTNSSTRVPPASTHSSQSLIHDSRHLDSHQKWKNALSEWHHTREGDDSLCGTTFSHLKSNLICLEADDLSHDSHQELKSSSPGKMMMSGNRQNGFWKKVWAELLTTDKATGSACNDGVFRKVPLSQAHSGSVSSTENSSPTTPSPVSHRSPTVTSSGGSVSHSHSSPSLPGLLMGSYAPSKRQLTEDTDASDCEMVVISKKQRTRNLEMSRKEVYHAVYLENLTVSDMVQKITPLFRITSSHIHELFIVGPSGITILVTDVMIQNFKDQSRYAIRAIPDDTNPEKYNIILKAIE